MPVHRCRIRLVDDHPQVRHVLRSLLAPYEDVNIIAEAVDGKQAIEMADSCRPDVVLMDINMPRMNGIEAAGIIKKSRQETVIIGLCVVQDTYIVNAFLKAGATAVISKDRFDDLYRTLQRACTSKSSPSPRRNGRSLCVPRWPSLFRQIEHIATGHLRQDHQRHVGMSRNRHPLEQDLKLRDVRMGLAKLEAGGTAHRFEDFIMGRAAFQAVGIVPRSLSFPSINRIHFALSMPDALHHDEVRPSVFRADGVNAGGRCVRPMFM